MAPRRSLRKKTRVFYEDFVDNFESVEESQDVDKGHRTLANVAKRPEGASKPSPKKELKQQVELLRQQSQCLHEVVDKYFLKVKTAAEAWLENKAGSSFSSQDVKKALEDTLTFVTNTTGEISSITHGVVKVPQIEKEKEKAKPLDKRKDEKTQVEGKKPEAKPKKTKSSVLKKKPNEVTEKETTQATSLTCEVCNRQFTSKPKLSAHRRYHFYKFQYKCQNCDRTFQFKSELSRHQLSHTGEKAFKCEFCGKLFQGRQGLEKHKEKHLPVRPEYRCDVCDKVLGSKNYLQRHKRIHMRDNPFTCHVCGKGCIDAKTLHEHLRKHTGEKPFKCGSCDSSFTRKSYLSQHIKCVHKRESRFQCDECGKKFVDKWYMNVHKQLHRPETPYLCDYCGKGYKNKYSLKSHKQTHTDIDPHICDVCGKGFKTKGSLKDHKRSHSSEKPHECEVCGKCFRDRIQLTAHKWVHEKERPFKCDICGKSFPWQGRLNLHKRIHSAERPFMCDICGKGFKRKNDIRKHKMKVHERKGSGVHKSKEIALADQNQSCGNLKSSSIASAGSNLGSDGSDALPYNRFPHDQIFSPMPMQLSRPHEVISRVPYTVISRSENDLSSFSDHRDRTAQSVISNPKPENIIWNPNLETVKSNRKLEDSSPYKQPVQAGTQILQPVNQPGYEQPVQRTSPNTKPLEGISYDQSVLTVISNARSVEGLSLNRQPSLNQVPCESYVYEQPQHAQTQNYEQDHRQSPVYEQLQVRQPLEQGTPQQQSPYQADYLSAARPPHTELLPVPPQDLTEHQESAVDERAPEHTLYAGPHIPFPWNTVYTDKY